MPLNDRYTKHLVVSDSATVNPSQTPENVILVNSAGQKISTKTDAELNSRFRAGAGFDPWSMETQPVYLDQMWRFFNGVPYQASTGANTTTTGTASQYAINFNVVSTTGYAAGDLIVIAPGTAQQQIAAVNSVVNSTTLQLRTKIKYAWSAGTVVKLVWTNDTHPWNCIEDAWIWWLSQATMAEYANGTDMFGYGAMASTYTDANSKTNVPVGWESFGTAANISFLAGSGGTATSPNTRSGSSCYMAAANAAGSGVRSKTPIPVRSGQTLQVSLWAVAWAGTPTFSVVDADSTSTVIASQVIGGSTPYGAESSGAAPRPFTLEFVVPGSIKAIELRMTTAASTDIVLFDDVRVVDALNHHANSGRYIFDDSALDRPVVWIGDSWGTGTTPTTFGTMLSTRSGKTVTVVNAATSGQRLDQMNSRIATDVIPYGPRLCFVQYGANDIAQARSQANMEADIDLCISTLRAAGIKPIIVGIPPIASALSTSVSRNDQMRARVDLHNR